MKVNVKKLKKESFEWLKALLIGLVLFLFIRTFFFSNYVVEGESMMPTLKEGNKLFVNKIGYQFSELHHFDVIVFRATEKDDYVKRIIGLPGDKIEYHNDQLYINDEKVAEPFLKKNQKSAVVDKFTGDFTLKELTGEETVPPNSLFVLGDNRLGSWDSRHFGFISIDQVVGKVNIRYWPVSDFDMSL
ncbi:signal peptidase I [Bacillaceae bacterium Marseille-Q3522]|nr:signal peptidase I [Bacillaceae bacterium Marseille-Q3522]